MGRLLIAALLATVVISCNGTPLPGEEDEDRPAPATIDPLTTALEPGEAGMALEQLASALGSTSHSRQQLLEALQSPAVQLDEESLAAAFRSVIADEFEVGWLAFLLTLDAQRQGVLSEAAASLRSLAISAFSESVAVNQIRSNLNESIITLNEGRSALVETFSRLRPAGEGDAVVLLPEDVPDPTLSLARTDGSQRLLAERAAGFGTVASAVEQATTVEIMAGEDVSSTRVEVAALTRLALLTGRASDPPTSPFGRYVLTVPVPDQIVYSLAPRKTIGVILAAELPVVTLDVDSQGAAGATVLDVESERGDLRVRSSSRSIFGQEDQPRPAFGRPNPVLQSGFGHYQVVVDVPFINPANAPFRVTCIVPSLGARTTMTLAGREAQGELRASGRLNLAPVQVAGLAEDPQVVCAGSYGTVETGRIAIPEELVPELEPDE